MARVIAATYNGGHLYQPKVIKLVGEDDRKIYQFKPTLMDQIKAKQENIALIKSALMGVVNEPRGTGRRAKVKGMIVAGKTGTAQVIGMDKEKDSSEEEDITHKFRDHAWFVAIAPADNPRLALAILVENAGHGGSAAAPIAKEMIKTYFGKN
jgi:penicillin-binding protein 2